LAIGDALQICLIANGKKGSVGINVVQIFGIQDANLIQVNANGNQTQKNAQR
jgi:hypothetical protein